MYFNINDKSILLSENGRGFCCKCVFENGLEYFNRGLDDDSEYILLLYNKASCLVSLGEIEKAKAIFKKIINLCDKVSKSELVLNIKANSYTYLNDFDSARVVFDEILKYFPNNVDALVSRGICFKRDEKYGEALNCFDKVLELDQNNFEANLYKGELLIDFGDKQDSKQYVDRAFEICPNFPYASYLKGYYHFHVYSDYKKAIEYFDMAISLDFGFEKCHFYKGICCLLLGNTAEAKKSFENTSQFDEGASDEFIDEILQLIASNNED